MCFSLLVLNISLLIAADSPFSATINDPPRGGEDRLKEILANVNANEALYERIEVFLFKETKKGEDSTFKGPDHIKLSRTKTRTVYQNNMFYHKLSESRSTLGGLSSEISYVLGYDNERTLVLTDNQLANIHEDRFESPVLVRPHTLILGRARVNFPLSVYLHAGPELSIHPSAGLYKDFDVRMVYEKEEDTAGLHCLKIRVENKSKRWGTTDFRYIWLADERNYIPIKTEAYSPIWNAKIPLEDGIVDDLREISPGVWFPFHAVIRVYDTEALKDGKQVLDNSDEFTVEKVALNPNYDISLFRDITFPDGIPVYVIKNGKIVRSYYQNGARPRFQSKSRRWWYIGASLAGAALIGSGLYLLRRKRRSFHER